MVLDFFVEKFQHYFRETKEKVMFSFAFLVKMDVHDNDIYLNGVLYLEVLIIGGCLLLGIILISISIYQFVKEIKEKISKKEKWEVVAQNLIGLFSGCMEHRSTF